MRRALLAAGTAALLLTQPAIAAFPVIDVAQLLKWAQQAQQMTNAILQLQHQVTALTNVPPNLLSSVQGLFSAGLSNPLGDINGALRLMMTGQGTGTCAGGQQIMAQGMYAPPTGSDFTGGWLQSSAARNAGVSACMSTMMGSLQARIPLIQQLIQQLPHATSVTQIGAIQARIQGEMSIVQTQQAQAQMAYSAAAMQHWTAEDQIAQRQRNDSLSRMAQTSGMAGPAPSVAAPTPFGGPATQFVGTGSAAGPQPQSFSSLGSGSAVSYAGMTPATGSAVSYAGMTPITGGTYGTAGSDSTLPIPPVPPSTVPTQYGTVQNPTFTNPNSGIDISNVVGGNGQEINGSGPPQGLPFPNDSTLTAPGVTDYTDPTQTLTTPVPLGLGINDSPVNAAFPDYSVLPANNDTVSDPQPSPVDSGPPQDQATAPATDNAGG